MWRRLLKFWYRDDSLTVFLWLLAFFVFAMGPISHLVPDLRVLIDLCFGAVLISGILATVSSLRITILATLFTALAVGTTVLQNFISYNHALAVFSSFCDIPALALFLSVVLKQTMKPGPVTSDRVKGAIATYLLLAVFWSKAYQFVEVASPGSFSGINHSDPFSSFLYFSLVSLTTVGYGDILPVSVVARSLANAESLVGQLFPAIFIARLVTLEVENSKKS